MATLSNPIARSVRGVAAGTLSRIGPIRHLITMWITGLKRSPLQDGLPTVAPTTLIHKHRTESQGH